MPPKPGRGKRAKAPSGAGKADPRSWTLLTLTVAEAPPCVAYVPTRARLTWPADAIQPQAVVCTMGVQFAAEVTDAPAALRHQINTGAYVARWLAGRITVICAKPG